MHSSLIRDAGGRRELASRWVVMAETELSTAAHFGGGEERTTAADVIRDRASGLPLLPGTSIAGAFRGHLADVLEGYSQPEHPQVSTLFGGLAGTQSSVIVFDSLGRLPSGRSTTVRDGVAIDPASLIAERHRRFDFEVLPPGTRFTIRTDLLIPADADEDTFVSLLECAWSLLLHGELRVGRGRSRGLGALRPLSAAARRFDLTARDGWWEWLTASIADPIGDAAAAWPSRNAIATFADARERAIIDLDLIVADDVLVRSIAGSADAPDHTQLRSGDLPVIPGTTISGVLRKRALRIAHLVRERQGDGVAWVDGLFGPRLDRVPRASRLRIAEGTIAGATEVRTIRTQLDRLTGATFGGALFEEQPAFGGRVAIRMELRSPVRGELGLLLLILKDVLSGDVSFGGSSSVGRGILSGSASLRLPGGDKPLPIDNTNAYVLEQLVAAFRDAPLRSEATA